MACSSLPPITTHGTQISCQCLHPECHPTIILPHRAPPAAPTQLPLPQGTQVPNRAGAGVPGHGVTEPAGRRAAIWPGCGLSKKPAAPGRGDLTYLARHVGQPEGLAGQVKQPV